MEQKDKTCKNCKYYLEHYIINRTYFSAIGGHCINDTLIQMRKRDKYRLQENCEYWEDNTDVKTKRRKNIEDVLVNIEKHLSEISHILKLKT